MLFPILELNKNGHSRVKYINQRRRLFYFFFDKGKTST